MGGHYGSIHVRTEDRDAVRRAVEKIAGGDDRFLIAPPIGGWVTVFPNNHGQESTLSEALAEALPECSLIHCTVYDDDIFCYWAYERGKLIDSYNSCPDYFDENIKEPRGGNVEALSHLLLNPNKAEELQAVLDAERETFELHRQDRFASLFGLPNTDRAYEYLQGGETDGLRQWKQFVHVPDLAAEKAGRRAAAAQAKAEYKQLQKDGLLLVHNVEKRSVNKHFYTFQFWMIQPVTSEVLFASYDRFDRSGNGSSADLEWTAYRPPDWRPQKAGSLAFGPEDRQQISPSGTWRMILPAGRPEVRIWNQRENSLAIQKEFTGGLATSAFSLDDNWFFFVARHHSPAKIEFHRIPLRPGLKEAVFTDRELCFNALAPHPGGQFLAVVDNHGILVVMDVEQMQIVNEVWIKATPDPRLPEEVRQELIRRAQGGIQRHLAAHISAAELEEYRRQCARGFLPKDSVRLCQFSPDGELLICATAEGVRVLEWKRVLGCRRMEAVPVKHAADAETATVEFRGEKMDLKAIHDIAFDASRRRVLFCGSSGKVSYLALDDGRRGDLLATPDGFPVWNCTLTPDRTALVVMARKFGDAVDGGPQHFQIWNYQKLCERAGVAW